MQNNNNTAKPKLKAYNLYGIKVNNLTIVGKRYFIKLTKKAIDEGTKYLGVIEKIGEFADSEMNTLNIGDTILFIEYELSMGDTYYVVKQEQVIMKLQPEEDLSKSKT